MQGFYACSKRAEVKTRLQVPCIFVGYGDEEFGYRLWDSEKKKVVRSRDVVFHENETSSNVEQVMGGDNSTSEGVADMTPVRIQPEDVTNGRMQEPEQDEEQSAVEDDESTVDEENNTEGDEQGELPHPPEEVESHLRRSIRERQPSTRYSSSEYILITDEGEPESFQDVQYCRDRDCWVKAMQEEMNSLKKNDTYELVKLPKGKKTFKNKWVFKLKKDDRK